MDSRPLLSLVQPYNTIGNENLPCNFLLFVIIFRRLYSLSHFCQYIEFLFT
jgi:hypothetical protein